MNNYIIISRTYAETTPESAAIGDYSDTGFIEEKQQVTFRELVALMKTHIHASQSPDSASISSWYSTGFYIKDYGTNTEREENIHYHPDNAPNAAKYWLKAREFANKKAR